MNKNLPTFKITIDEEYSEDGVDLSWAKTAYTAQPAIKIKGMAFNAIQRKTLTFADEVKRRIVAPVMVPDLPIYRRDEDGFEYYVEFTNEDIEKIYGKYMQNYNVKKNNYNLEHIEEVESSKSYMLETWKVEGDPKLDKAYSVYGIEVPTGTVMQMHQITDKTFYDELVANEMYGFSIEGMLGLKLSDIINETKIDTTMKKETFALADGTTLELMEDGTYSIILNKDEEEKYEDMPEEKECPEGEDCPEEEAYQEEAPAVEEEKPAEDTGEKDYYLKSEIDDKFDELYRVIGELQAAGDKEEKEAPAEPVALNRQGKFSNLHNSILKRA